MQVFDQAKVMAAVTRSAALECVGDALRALDNGTAIMPGQAELVLPNGGELHVKGGYLIGSEWIVFKVASGAFPTPGNGGLSLVIGAESGAVEAVLVDKGWLTDVRTAAAGAIATNALARADASRLALLGTGIQARHQFEALKASRSLSHVAVWGRDAGRARSLASEIGGTAFATAREAVRSADIIYTVTMAREPILHGSWLRDGSHVTAIGADMVGKRELDNDCLRRAHHVVCDDVDLCARVGELQYGGVPRNRAVSLGAILTGRAQGRCSPSDVTVADLCGLGIEDVAIASLAMRRLEDAA